MPSLLLVFVLFFSFEAVAKQSHASVAKTSESKKTIAKAEKKVEAKLEPEIDDSRYYLNTEDDEVVSVFNIPGVNWYTCPEKPGCEAKAWPDNNAKITRTNAFPMIKQVYNPSTGKVEEEVFVEINYEYNRRGEDGLMHHQSGKAWIDSAYLSHVKRAPFFTKEEEPSKKDCAPKSKVEASKENINKSGSAISKALEYQNVFAAVEQISPLVGKCVIPPSPKKAIVESINDDQNPYDFHVLPEINKLINIPKVKKENGEEITRKDLIDIDALARTTYAEMARCYKYGLQYPMAVMRVSLNRSQYKTKFVRKTHDKNKGTLAKVVTSPSQYSTWLAKISGKKNISYRQALCPPSNPKKLFWTGGLPPRMEKNIWKNTLLMATETVLFPKKFKKRTSEIKVEHYTSGMDIETFYKMHLVNPPLSIGGRKIDLTSCLQLWK